MKILKKRPSFEFLTLTGNGYYQKISLLLDFWREINVNMTPSKYF